jgi:mannose-6-phosphate isomerase
MPSIYKLKGKVQHYAWGGKDFIPQLIHFYNIENKPCAEYWMGAHPSASATIVVNEKEVLLKDYIQQNASEVLTEKVYQQFGELPYLYKILDVHDMLSIQVHPSKEEAAKGFEREEKEGVAITASYRNYKDKNHKPEVMIALGEFWLLHGFMDLKKIEQRLLEVKELNVLLPLFKAEGLKALYQFLMEMEVKDSDSILQPLLEREIAHKKNGLLNKSMPGWWASKLFNEGDVIQNIDKGVFSIYLFNIVGLQYGEGIFQAAGVPHAYLEGQNVELMANSDNVLRGGLTPKHIDVPELLKHTIFKPITPHILSGEIIGNYEKKYPCPVPDFAISKITLDAGNTYSALSTSPEIIIAIKGGCVVNSHETNMPIKTGEAFFVLPQNHYSITASGHCELYKAYV